MVVSGGSFSAGSSSGSGGTLAPGKTQFTGTFGLTGLTDSKNAPSGRDTVSFTLGPGPAATVIQCPSYWVPRGARVQVIGASGNSNACTVGRDRNRVAAGFGDPLPPSVVVEFDVTNTGELFVYLSTNTDKVTVRVLQD